MHYIPKALFVTSNENAHLNTNPVTKKIPKMKKNY